VNIEYAEEKRREQFNLHSGKSNARVY